MNVTLSPEVILILTGAGGVISTLAGFVYKELKAQIADRDTRIGKLETEARDAIKIKDQETAEWKRLALTRHVEPPR